MVDTMNPRTSASPLLPGLRALAVIVAIAGVTTDARSQTVSASTWHQGTTLAGFAGAASTSSETGPAAGLALGWEFTPHFGLEGRGIWLDAGAGADAFAAAIGTRMPLTPGHLVVPYVSAGAGVYRTTVNGTRGDDDFAAALGAGIDVFLAKHLALRPDVTVLFVRTRVDTEAVPVFGVHLAYHFESHPITPTRQGR